MIEIYFGTRVTLTDDRSGMVYSIEKPSSDPETWRYLVDVDGLSVEADMGRIYRVLPEDPDDAQERREIRKILVRQRERVEAILEAENARLERIKKLQWLMKESWFND